MSPVLAVLAVLLVVAYVAGMAATTLVAIHYGDRRAARRARQAADRRPCR